ncbi:MAG TPA: SBBP repeat-containing protein [Terriglobia bacterium]|nr:SBBP repeat-containing protein [Terriglobia bacterium]
MYKMTARATARALAGVVALCGMAAALVAQTAGQAAPGRAQLVQSYVKLPLSFEANRGQADGRVRFTARGAGYTLYLTSDGAMLALRNPADQQPGAGDSTVLGLRFVDSNTAASVAGLDQLPGNTNYFIGSDPQKWRMNVPTYGKVRYGDVYPGVDLLYYGNQRQLEYDLVVAPGADPRVIQWKMGRLAAGGRGRLEGTKSLDFSSRGTTVRIAENGDLMVTADGREIRLRKPVAYQNASAKRLVEARYVLRAHHQIGIKLGPYDRHQPLIIDPVLTYSTYLGGSGNDGGIAIVVDSSGNAYVAGGTTSTDFPVENAFQPAYGGGSSSCTTYAFQCGDAFVTKINPSGSALVYSTYLGGSNSDTAFSLAVNSAGNAYVTGKTYSTNFPTTSGAFQTALPGVHNAFVTELNTTGSALVYSTYLGGSGEDTAAGLAIDGSGNAYVVGRTDSTNFPTTTGAFQTTEQGGDDGFVTKLNPTGTALVYSTYLGGAADDAANGIALDSSDNAYIAGQATSSGFPTVNAFQSVFGGGGTDCGSGILCGDAILAKLNATGSALLYSTYLGGAAEEAGVAITVDSAGNAYMSGGTDSTNFPVTYGAPQPTYGGGSAVCATAGIACGDAFVAKVNTLASGSASLVFATYLGGSGDDLGLGVGVDSSGYVHVSGGTNSTNFPVSPTALEPSFGGGTTSCGSDMLCGDAFVATLTNLGSVLVYSSYLGGSGDDFGTGLALGTAGNAYITGITLSTNFPVTTGAYDTTCSTCSGASDAFISLISGDAVLPLADSPTLSVDFNGDGDASLPIWRPDAGTWYVETASGTETELFGLSGDVPVAADFDGDGKSDIGMWRPSSGTWYYISSVTGLTVSKQWGETDDIPVPADYDGDGKADFAVWRPSNGTWYYISSRTGETHSMQWGLSGDIPVPGDYDGDGRGDLAVWRPSNGTWYYIASSTGQTDSIQFGLPGDIPVEGDYDGAARTELAVWRPSDVTWYYLSSTGQTVTKQWGELGDIPVVGDYDGDGKNDYAIWRPATGQWWIIYSSNGKTGDIAWGVTGDIPAAHLPSMYRRDKHVANYDGDRKTDIAVWRPSNATYYVIYSSSGQQVTEQWGETGDVIAPGDYDGDGKTDYAIWRPSNGTWYVSYSTTKKFVTEQWGSSGDIPVPGDYDGDGKTDYAIWRPSNQTWYVIYSSTGKSVTEQWGASGDIPVPGDYDGDGRTDYAIWRPSNATFYVNLSSTGKLVTEQWGVSTDIPVPGDYDGDTKTDYTIFRPSTGTWYTLQSSNGKPVTTAFGLTGDVPVAKDYDGDEKTDIAVFRPSNGTWYILQSSNGQLVTTQWGVSTDVPVNAPIGQ